MIVGELGVTDVSGVFVIDWRTVSQITELEFARRFVLAGLTNHALFSALAGAGLALLLVGRRRLALACLLAALGGHSVSNAVAGPIIAGVLDTVLQNVNQVTVEGVPLMLAGWLAGLSAFLVAEGWAALLLLRAVRMPKVAAPPHVPPASEPVSAGT
jgi:hypothetical protein